MLDRDDGGRGGIRSPDGVRARTDGGGERDLVDVPRAGAGGRLVADDEDERHVRLHGLGEGGQRVGEACAVRRGRRGEASRRAEVGVGGDDAARLVAHRGVLHVGGTLESVEEVRVAVAHDTEDVVDVAGEGLGDVRGDGGHGGSWEARTVRDSVYVSRAPFSSTGARHRAPDPPIVARAAAALRLPVRCRRGGP